MRSVTAAGTVFRGRSVESSLISVTFLVLPLARHQHQPRRSQQQGRPHQARAVQRRQGHSHPRRACSSRCSRTKLVQADVEKYVQERTKLLQHRFQIRFQIEPAAALHLRTLVQEDVGLLELLLRLTDMFFRTVSRSHVVGIATPTDVRVKFNVYWVFHSKAEGIRLGRLELPAMCRA